MLSSPEQLCMLRLQRVSFCYVRQHTVNQSARGLLAVGGVPYQQSGTGLGDLPSSRNEAVDAAAALPNRSNTLLLGNEATETAFKKSVDHRIIHLAVHAIANKTSPDRAAFVLLSDPQHGEDGSLYPSEIVQLPLDADLVVLSACETAVGPIEGEEGISTLARAFLLAGTRTVVSTLWTIDDDSTLYLMKVFYAELARKKSVPEALKSRQEEHAEKVRPTQRGSILLGGAYCRRVCSTADCAVIREKQ